MRRTMAAVITNVATRRLDRSVLATTASGYSRIRSPVKVRLVPIQPLKVRLLQYDCVGMVCWRGLVVSTLCPFNVVA